MPLKKRPIDRFRLVCTHDEALHGISDTVIRAYFDAGRDWDLIAAEIDKLEERPTIFVCEPLRAAFDGAATSGEVADLKRVFAAHVTALENAPADCLPVFLRDGDKQFLDMGYVDSLPIQWVIDIAGAVISRGMANSDPFSPPAGFWHRRMRATVLRHAAQIAAARGTEIAKSQDESGSAVAQ